MLTVSESVVKFIALKIPGEIKPSVESEISSTRP